MYMTGDSSDETIEFRIRVFRDFGLDLSRIIVTDNSRYRAIYCPGHPNAWPSTGYIPEHRLIMSLMLGRPLAEGEVVHHRDSNTLNASFLNLEVSASQSDHIREHHARFQSQSGGIEMSQVTCTVCEERFPKPTRRVSVINCCGPSCRARYAVQQREVHRERLIRAIDAYIGVTTRGVQDGQRIWQTQVERFRPVRMRGGNLITVDPAIASFLFSMDEPATFLGCTPADRLENFLRGFRYWLRSNGFRSGLWAADTLKERSDLHGDRWESRIHQIISLQTMYEIRLTEANEIANSNVDNA